MYTFSTFLVLVRGINRRDPTKFSIKLDYLFLPDKQNNNRIVLRGADFQVFAIFSKERFLIIQPPAIYGK